MNEKTTAAVQGLKASMMETKTGASAMELAANYRDMANMIEEVMTSATQPDPRHQHPRKELEVGAAAIMGLMLQAGKQEERRLLDEMLVNLKAEAPNRRPV